MKKEDLYRAMEGIEDDLLEESERALQPHTFAYRRILITAALMGACALIVAVLPRMGAAGADSGPAEAALAEDKAETDDAVTITINETAGVETEPESYYGSVQAAGELNAMETFYTKTFVLLDDSEENTVISPLNIAFAVSMLGEITAGDTQAEILQALGVRSIDELRNENAVLYAANNVRMDELTSMTGNSLWLSDAYTYVPETLDILQNFYHADSFTGVPGTAQYDEKLQAWLNDHTGHLLAESVKGVHLSEDTVLALASALYYKAAWTDGFQETDEVTVFHAKHGDEEARFMQRTDDGGFIYPGRTYEAVELSLRDSGSMWIFLPKEGYTTSDVLRDEGLMMTVRHMPEYEQQEALRVHITMPEFDVNSDLSLRDRLPELGIGKVLGRDADFSGITAGPLTLSEVKHAARIITDTEGVTGAAYTVMVFDTAMAPQEYRDVYFTVDRPFVFVVTGADGSLLFTGTVNHPQ